MRVSEFASKVSELAARREPFAVATVTKTEGSTLAKVGFKILISHDGHVVGGTLGGGCPEGPIVEMARRGMRDGTPQTVRVHLVDAGQAVAGTLVNPRPGEIYVETNCGGTLEVYIEPMMPSERLVLIAQGGKDDIEEELVLMGKQLGFEVVVVDPVPVLREEPHLLLKSAEIDPQTFPLGGRDYVVVLTKGERDVSILQALSKTNAKFVGLLASRHRLRKNLEELRALGVPEEFVASLHAPIGLDIGATTPAELALSILADVVATKYGKDIPHKPAP
ncbi:MAG: XdhC family protein [Euryarchaeota archaeon]|nr:XdhC family protein [Euryarchaeota archaeon]